MRLTSKQKKLHEQLMQLLHVCIGTTSVLSIEDWYSKCLECAGTFVLQRGA